MWTMSKKCGFELKRGIQCILAYLNPFGSLAQNFVQISETAFIMYIQYNLKCKISPISDI